MSVFREAGVSDQLRADASGGPCTLEATPSTLTLTAAGVRCVITSDSVRLETPGRRRPKVEALAGPAPICLALDGPRDEFGLWLRETPRRARRIFGVSPKTLLNGGDLGALSGLGRIVERTARGLVDLGRADGHGLEVGVGLDKVLVVDRGDVAQLFVRRLFRKASGLTAEVQVGGAADVGGRQVTCRQHFGVIVTGDDIVFLAKDGDTLASVAVPWLPIEDRHTIANELSRFIASDQVALPRAAQVVALSVPASAHRLLLRRQWLPGRRRLMHVRR